MRLEFTATARDDLIDLFERGLGEFGPDVAQQTATAIARTLRRLQAFPLSARPLDGRGDGVRRAAVGKFGIFYIPAPDHLLILRVLHGRMDVARRLREPR